MQALISEAEQGYAVDSRSPRCSSPGHEAVSCEHGGFHGYVSDGGRVLGVFEHRAVAGRISMFALREGGLLEKGSWPFHLPPCGYEASVLAGTLFQDHAQTAPLVVPGD